MPANNSDLPRTYTHEAKVKRLADELLDLSDDYWKAAEGWKNSGNAYAHQKLARRAQRAAEAAELIIT